ncbi:MAG: sulfite exporter TauE/SafE family protein [Anaerolineales bacterium]
MASAFIGLTLARTFILLFDSALRTRHPRFQIRFTPDFIYARLLWGLLPCGLVLTALVTAIAAKSAVFGALNMLIFGIATVPSLLAVKLLANKSNSRIWSRGLAATSS